MTPGHLEIMSNAIRGENNDLQCPGDTDSFGYFINSVKCLHSIEKCTVFLMLSFPIAKKLTSYLILNASSVGKILDVSTKPISLC